MKILVADDDRLDRKLLTTCLEKAGYTVLLVEDGVAALRALLQPDAPTVAVVDWSMPGLTGPEVCAKLRSVRLRVRPYVIMLTAKSDKPDIASALDAGADDFVNKPFNSGELLARVRVAIRTLKYQAELQEQVRAFEALASRYNLLGEIAAQHEAEASTLAVPGNPTSPAAAAAAPEAKPETGATTAVVAAPRAVLPVGILEPGELSELVLRFLHERGVGPASRQPMPPDGRKPAGLVTAWAGLILVGEGIWIDLLLEAELATATSVFAKFLSSRKAAGNDLPGFLAEAQTILSVMFKTTLQEQGKEVLTPFLSHAKIGRADALIDANAARTLPLHFDVGGTYLGVTIVQTEIPPRVKTAKQLRNLDVVAEPFPPSQIDSVPMFTPGVVLNERFIGKLIAFDESKMATHAVAVFEPSAIARHFCGPRE